MKYQLICVFIMWFATFLPRVVPLTFFDKKIKSTFIKSFLYYIPYAVLTALTFPAIFTACGNVYASIGGTIAAIVASLLKKQNLVLTILISVVVSYIIIIIF